MSKYFNVLILSGGIISLSCNRIKPVEFVVGEPHIVGIVKQNNKSKDEVQV